MQNAQVALELVAEVGSAQAPQDLVEPRPTKGWRNNPDRKAPQQGMRIAHSVEGDLPGEPRTRRSTKPCTSVTPSLQNLLTSVDGTPEYRARIADLFVGTNLTRRDPIGLSSAPHL